MEEREGEQDFEETDLQEIENYEVKDAGNEGKVEVRVFVSIEEEKINSMKAKELKEELKLQL